MKWFLCLCAACFLGSAIVWILPGSIKPYHISRWIDDYDSGLIEYDSEIGFADSGLVKVRTLTEYSGGIPGALDQVRKDWRQNSLSKTRWPADSSKLQYNGWGPSRYTQPDLVEVMQVGTLYLLPYSLVFLSSSATLLIGSLVYLRRRRRIANLTAPFAGGER